MRAVVFTATRPLLRGGHVCGPTQAAVVHMQARLRHHERAWVRHHERAGHGRLPSADKAVARAA